MTDFLNFLTQLVLENSKSLYFFRVKMLTIKN